MKKFDFKKQILTGDIGEKDFYNFYKKLSPVKSEDDLAYDFKLKNGDTIELKTDTYNMENTPNFFMEYYSDMKAQKMGGPWRAYNDSVKMFVYYFIENKTFYWFNTKDLYNVLEKYIASKNPRLYSVVNKGWITKGFVIPRKELDSALIKIDTF